MGDIKITHHGEEERREKKARVEEARKKARQNKKALSLDAPTFTPAEREALEATNNDAAVRLAFAKSTDDMKALMESRSVTE